MTPEEARLQTSTGARYRALRFRPVNPLGHIDLRVRNLEAATPFYDALLPLLGFTERYHGGEWKVWATTDPAPEAAYFAVTEDPAHAANANRIALQVRSTAEVDRVGAAAQEAGATLSGPKEMPYGPGYYAAYFDDPSGNRLEVYVRPD
jgi:catechol 2,3-dioxygenase-like lactoylglutathione lyase family enzyme